MLKSSTGTARILAILLALAPTAATARAQIRPDAEALAAAPPALLARMRDDAYVYFRFVNRPWLSRVCSVFSRDIGDMRDVRVHGDAHVEQFAVTRDAWGLDDFDDSARGPALVDIVRFLGSVDLAARQRGWTESRDTLFDRFFRGYGRGLADPDTAPAVPSVVRRLRALPVPSRHEFLVNGEQLMEPPAEPVRAAVVRGLDVFAALVRAQDPALPPGYFDFVSAGWLHLGIGSFADQKFLIRVQGPSSDPDDDELLEAKRLANLEGLPCLDVVTVPPTQRIALGASQLGRLSHHILTPGPDAPVPADVPNVAKLRYWWIRSWEPSYREIAVTDMRTVEELAEIAEDAGLQLGAGSLREEPGGRGRELRRLSAVELTRHEAAIRRGTAQLVDELLAGWQAFAAGAK